MTSKPDVEADEIARARAAKQGSPFLNTEQAAAYLGLSPRQLQYMRAQCTGPRYRLHSRFVRYHVDDLAFWSRSTAPEPGARVRGSKETGVRFASDGAEPGHE